MSLNPSMQITPTDAVAATSLEDARIRDLRRRAELLIVLIGIIAKQAKTLNGDINTLCLGRSK